MLTRLGQFDEEDLVDAAKFYLPLYGKFEKEVCKVPFKDLDESTIRYVVFTWLANQWVFTDIQN